MPNGVSARSREAHIVSLENKHRELEEHLKGYRSGGSDGADFELKMLKRRKLFIKDEIERNKQML